MTDRDQSAIEPGPSDLHALLEEAIHNLSLGIVIFNDKRQVVFCNRRYMQMYGLSAEQVKPGTPTSALIQHRLNLGLKVRGAPEEYIRRACRPRYRARHHRAGIHRRPHHRLYRASVA